jgi:uncharacterized membrane protein
MKKINSLLLYVAIAITTIVTIYYFFVGNQESNVGTLLIWAYILLALGVVLLICIPILNIGANPASLKKAAVSIAFLVALFVIAYILSSDAQTVTTQAMLTPPSATTMKITDTGLYATYLLMVLSIGAILFGTIYGSVKKS